MVISWYGQNFFQILSSGTNLVIDPYPDNIGLKRPRLRADILLVTKLNQVDIKAAGENPFLITGPGEYEIKGITVRGIPELQDKNQGITCYKFEVEKIKICHLGNLKQKELSQNQLDSLEEVDILMIPVGGNDFLDEKEAAKIVNQIEPKIVIPMAFKIPGLNLPLETVDKFLKELGVEKKEPQEKLSLKKKELSPEGMEIVVMKPL